MAKGRKSPVLAAVQPSAMLEIDGEKFQLVFDYNAIADAEALTGANLLHGISAALVGTLTAAQLRGLLYAALQAKHPYVPPTQNKPESGVSLRRAGEMCRIDRLPAIYRAIAEAWALSMPEKNPPKADAPAARKS